jgi:hypothetical protein
MSNSNTDDMKQREQEVPSAFITDWLKAPLGPPKGLDAASVKSFARPFSGDGGPSAAVIAERLSKAGYRKPKT